jgi:type I restriction enzyme, S subunit
MTNGWQTVQLAEVLKQDTNYVSELEPITYPKLSVKLYGKGVTLDSPTDGANVKMQRHQFAKPGQIIVSEIWAKKGAIGIVPPEGEGALVTSHFFLFDIDKTKIEPTFIGWFLKRNYFAETLDAHAHGTTGYAAVRPKQFLALEIPLPPLTEQRRIVAHIESLAARVNEAQRLREEVDAESSLLFGTALKRAYDQAVQIADKTERLDDLCTTITDGTHVTPTYMDEGIPFLSVKDISSGIINFNGTRLISPEEHAFLTKRCKPERDDILLTKVGTTGIAKVVDVDREFSIFVSIALLKLDKSRLNPKFAEYMLNSPILKQHSSDGTRGVGNKNLVLKFIKEFPMPHPPLDEQRRIVAYLDGLQAKVNALRELQSASGEELSALMPSVLDRAFKGEL